MKGEEKPKNVFDLSERRKRKEEMAEAEKRKKRGEISPDGYLWYTDKKPEITPKEALALADEVIKKFSDPEILLDDFLLRENEDESPSDYLPPEDADPKKKMESKLAFERMSAGKSKTEDLLVVMALYKKMPANFYGIQILAVAEALKKRLGPRPPEAA